MIDFKAFAGAFTAAALMLGAPVGAQAAVISFNNLVGENATPFTSYSEAGFTVTKTAGDAFIGKNYGAPLPSIFAGPFYGSSSTTLEITAGGRAFSFEAWDFLANGGAAAYVINGFLNGGNVFSAAGITDSTVQTLLSGTSLSFDRVTFALTASGSSMNFDNFEGTISAVPEPATWAMMIVGLGAVGCVVRSARRRNAFSVA